MDKNENSETSTEAEQLQQQIQELEESIALHTAEATETRVRSRRLENENAIVGKLVEHGCTRPQIVMRIVGPDLDFQEEDGETTILHNGEPVLDVDALVDEIKAEALPELFNDKSPPHRSSGGSPSDPYDEAINELERIR
jgi:hypothetical protein